MLELMAQRDFGVSGSFQEFKVKYNRIDVGAGTERCRRVSPYLHAFA